MARKQNLDFSVLYNKYILKYICNYVRYLV